MAKRIGIFNDLHGRLLNPTSRKDNYFEACMNKLEYIVASVDVLFSTGDLFDKARTEDVVKNRMLAIFNKYKIPVFIVPGNHDIEKDNLETLPRTSLGNLAYHKAITIMDPNKVYEVEGIKFGSLKYDIAEAKAQRFENVDIVLGHHFYDWWKDPEHKNCLSAEDIANYNVPYIFLGHDHEPHQIVQIGNTLVYRTGSVMRQKLESYTEKHMPNFCKFTVEDGIMSDITVEIIPHTKFTDAFLVEEKRTFKKCTKLVSDIKSFLESIDLQTSSKKTIGQILRDPLKAPEEVIDYLQLIYRVNHLQF